MRRSGRLALAWVLLLVASACSGSSRPVPAEPTGVIVLGHSLNTGLDADPDRPGIDAREYSWATGTAAEVDSIYVRLVATDPRHEGWVANEARNGSLVHDMVDQAPAALEEVPNPALVLIQSLDNDIRCDGTDADQVDQLGEDLAAVLDVVTEQAPDATIVFTGSPGGVGDYVAMLESHPHYEPEGEGGVCDLFDAEGNRHDAGIEALTSIVGAYERELAQVCGRYPQCVDATAAADSWRPTPASFAIDLQHPSVKGHRELAEVIWPAVAAALGLAGP